MEVPTHILDQQKVDVAIETSNPSIGKKIYFYVSNGRGLNFQPPLQTAQRI
jgi:hypothetical protein